jgi:hypothetical protein
MIVYYSLISRLCYVGIFHASLSLVIFFCILCYDVLFFGIFIIIIIVVVVVVVVVSVVLQPQSDLSPLPF